MDVLDHSSLVTRGITRCYTARLGSRTEKIDIRKLRFWSGVGTEITLSSKGSWGSRCKHVPVIYCGSRSVQDAESRNVRRQKHQHGVSRHDKEAEKSIDSALTGHPEFPGKTSIYRSHGFAEAWRHAYNDAKFVNERAKNDMILLSRGITKLNVRARQDVAIIGVEFLKLDARAREDTVKIDDTMNKKASRLQRLAETLQEKARTKLKKVADKHWSAGALEADLRRADFFARRRAMEDAYMAITLIKSIHDIMVGTVYHSPKNDGTTSQNSLMGQMMLEENGKTVDLRAGEVSADRITAIQEAYMSMASALSEADGIDYTDPDELELLVATLIDLDAMDGKSSVSLLVECSSSPDVSTRQALANALGAASSMWTLGNAGMGALQRLAEDSNPAVAKAASKAIHELKRQWEIEEADNWLFKIDLKPTDSDGLESLDSDSNSDVQEDEP